MPPRLPCTQHLVRPGVRLWHQASLFQTLEMAADADAALAALAERGATTTTTSSSSSSSSSSGSGAAASSGSTTTSGSGAEQGGLEPSDAEEAETASVGACLAAIEAVSPGSDLHAQLAARARRLAARRRARCAPGSAEAGEAEAAAQEAERRCVRAQVLRYGAGLVEAEAPRLFALSEELALQGVGQGLVKGAGEFDEA